MSEIKLERSLERWAGCNPYAIGSSSQAAVMYFASAAQKDIAALAAAVATLLSEIEALKAALTQARECLDGEPTYHHEGMGCGLEDRNITDRYDAMHHGWECALERVYGEHIVGAREIIDAALAQGGAL